MEVTCDYCGKIINRPPSRIRAYKNQFCGTECHDRFRDRHVDVPCVVCGTIISMKASRVEHAEQHTCSRECKAKLVSEYMIARRWKSAESRVALCAHCGNPFERKPSQLIKYPTSYCSRECKRLGQQHPQPEMQTGSWFPCETCRRPVWRTPATLQPHVFCSRECTHQGQGPLQPKMFGPANPAWNGGSSIAPYTWGFQLPARVAIKERDGYRCQICGKTREQGRLAVHHIDLGTTNHDPSNLTTLCVGCHRRVHQTKHPPA